MAAKLFRLLIGFFLIFTILPPLSMHLLNIFVILPALVGIALIFLPNILKLLKAVFGKSYKSIIKIITAVLVLACIFFSVEFIVIFINSFPQKAPDNSVVVVLGAKVDTIILSGRINAAAIYLKSHPNSVCIATGGQGSDEPESEAKCIKDALISQYGISSKRIFTDNTSKDTGQNLDNAIKIIKENNLSDNVAIATDGFHMFRAKFLAGNRGLKAYACPAKTDGRLVLTFYLRELFALPKSVILNR